MPSDLIPHLTVVSTKVFIIYFLFKGLSSGSHEHTMSLFSSLSALVFPDFYDLDAYESSRIVKLRCNTIRFRVDIFSRNIRGDTAFLSLHPTRWHTIFISLLNDLHFDHLNQVTSARILHFILFLVSLTLCGKLLPKTLWEDTLKLDKEITTHSSILA